MAYLSGRHGACLRRGEPEDAAASLQAQRDFLGDHLLPWVPEFCQDVSRSAESDFFVGMAYLTEGFLTWDDRFLREVNGPSDLSRGWIV
jgi:TorA maturation chaperone TorD